MSGVFPFLTPLLSSNTSLSTNDDTMASKDGSQKIGGSHKRRRPADSPDNTQAKLPRSSTNEDDQPWLSHWSRSKHIWKYEQMLPPPRTSTQSTEYVRADNTNEDKTSLTDWLKEEKIWKTSLLTPSDLPLEEFREFGGSRKLQAPEDASKSAEAVPDLAKVQEYDEDKPWMSHWSKDKKIWETATWLARAHQARETHAMESQPTSTLAGHTASERSNSIGITVHPSVFPLPQAQL